MQRHEERRRDEHPAARPQHAAAFRQGLGGVAQMLQHFGQQDAIERIRPKRQVLGGCNDIHPCSAVACALHIETADLGEIVAVDRCVRACPGTRIEKALLLALAKVPAEKTHEFVQDHFIRQQAGGALTLHDAETITKTFDRFTHDVLGRLALAGMPKMLSRSAAAGWRTPLFSRRRFRLP